MNAFLDLSLLNGIILLAAGVAIPGLIVVLVARMLVKNHLTKQHERVGRLLFRVTASLLALLISLSYANEKISYNKVSNSLQEEAAVIASVMLKLKIHRSELAEQTRDDIVDYVEFTIDDDWVQIVNNPYVSKMWAKLVFINIVVQELPEDSEKQKALKASIITDINLITKTLQIRIYSTQFHLPYLTYILGLGLIIVWCFFSVYRVDRISIVFITLYNIFIAVILYFVIMLGNPMNGPLKIDPAPFIILKEMGLEKLPF